MKIPPVVSVKKNPWDVDCQSANDGMTDQTQAEDCDINNIMRRFEATGVLPPGREPLYGDLTRFRSYKESLDLVSQADRVFGSLDATFRSSFDNDVSKFLSWLGDPSNIPEAVKRGIVDPSVALSAPASSSPSPSKAP